MRMTRCLQVLGTVLGCLVAFCGLDAKAQGCGYRPKTGPPYMIVFKFSPQNGSASGPLLTVVALGDSVVWGDGDKPAHRIVSVVGQELADKRGRPVEVHSYAHSGAKLGAPSGGPVSSASSYPHPFGHPMGDVDSDLPTTNEQADCAAINDSGAEIVMLDGCINEVGAANIALPHIFPDQETPDQVRAAVLASCAVNMRGLLDRVKIQFSRAQIVVLNYYRVVSSNSTPKPLLAEPDREKAAAAETERTKQLGKVVKKRLGRTPTQDEVEKQKQAWDENSAVFLLDSTSCFNWAIAAVNTGVSNPLPQTAPPYDPNNPVGVCPAPLASSPANSRVALAALPDNPDYSYGAAATHIWLLPTLFSQDEMYWTRTWECVTHLCRHDTDCFVNAIAHPNIKGAQCYGKVILSAIDGVQPTWDADCQPPGIVAVAK